MSIAIGLGRELRHAIVCSESRTHRFAARELQKYLQQVCGVCLPIVDRADGPAFILKQTGVDADRDEYTIRVEDENICVVGSNARSVLFGVYAFLENVCGVRFFSPEFEVVPTCERVTIPAEFSLTQTASFAIRTLRAEWTMNVKLVDWAAKNYYNAFSLDMWRWDGSTEWVDATAILDAMADRGMAVEGSGHSMCYFLKSSEHFDAHPEWFPEVDGQRVRAMYTGDNLCYSNSAAVEQCAENVVAFLRRMPMMKRLSIWMGDGGAVCSCRECRKRPFMELYGDAVRRIADRVKKTLGDVIVFQEAYNFNYRGAFDTIEDKTRTLRVPPMHHDVPTLFAFWGQDLSIPLAENSEHGHRLFHSCLKEYCQANAANACVFSMHTDTFMLSNMCPVFGSPIMDDVREFHRLGIDQMFLLWITWNTESEQNMEWVGYQNGALWSRGAVDRSFDIEHYRREYYRWAVGADQASQAETLWNRLNTILNRLQSLTFPFAPFRSTDVWGCGFSRQHPPLRWKLDTDFGPWTEERIKMFAESEPQLEALNRDAASLNDADRPECVQFKKYVEHNWIRSKGLLRLFKAQRAMQASAWSEAQMWLERALDTGMTDERADTLQWLEFVKNKLAE